MQQDSLLTFWYGQSKVVEVALRQNLLVSCQQHSGKGLKMSRAAVISLHQHGCLSKLWYIILACHDNFPEFPQ